MGNVTITLHDDCTTEVCHRAGDRRIECPHDRVFLISAIIPRDISYRLHEFPRARGIQDTRNEDLFG